ncbi:MAG: calcium-translocating P-type ATPase, SERCA-type [Firmicutes bacterium ZCTH02-B6]|nr:MAG: calcium-translocating P-type ATPase, SERCA-type [Firmicutes bacterium ZCTH02-B6]
MAEPAWHQLSVAETLERLATHPETGLPEEEARRRLVRHGPNRLPEQEGPSPLALFIKQFTDLMVLVLVAAALVSALLGEVLDAAAIFVIVLLNGVLGFVQEYRAEQSLAALKRLAAPTARVVRDGLERIMPAADLVPGDVVLLEDGDRVPADGRLVEARSLAVDESLLTGESAPVIKDAGARLAAQTPLADRTNMVFMGTSVARGRGVCVVTGTGMQTQIGQIAEMIQEAEPQDTPLQQRLEQLGKVLVLASLAVVAVVFAAGVLRGFPVYRMFLTAVSLAVAAIPEGLPAVVTIALALGVQRMLRRRAIIRRLPAVETLGCATVVCSDKTGTLTRNEMTVTRLWLGGREIEVTGTGYVPEGEFLAGGTPLDPGSNVDLRLALRIAATCNHARLQRAPQGHGWQALGDPTEAALVVAAAKAGIAPARAIVGEIPFDGERKRMSVLLAQGGKLVLMTKGAPDVLLPRCDRWRRDGRVEPLRVEDRRRILAAVEAMARQALRVLAVAYAERPAGPVPRQLDDNWEQQLVFVGLLGMIDPPRPEVRAALKKARDAGIRTVVITGDHRDTALAIARDLGIVRDASEVATGADLDRWSAAALEDAVRRVQVFARVAPEHKLRIVRTLRQQGEVVAMTGDGVNDAPALKEADIGVAMGVTGTDVTRDAADMVLADDNYATIVAAIEEGRGIYDNIRRFVRYLLGCNIGEVITMFAAALAALPLPLSPLMILWVNLVTDGLPAIALGMTKPDEDIMRRPPRSPKEGVFSRGLHWKILGRGLLIAACTLAVFVIGLRGPGGESHARTLAFTVLVLAQLVYAFQCQSEHHSVFEVGFTRNPPLVAAVATSLAMHVAVLYVPLLQRVFGLVPLDPGDWLLVFGFSAWYLGAEALLRAAGRAFRSVAGFRA